MAANGATDPGQPASLRWRSATIVEIGGVEYRLAAFSNVFPSEPRCFCLRKTHEEVSRYAELIAAESPRRIFEAGIYHGASTALIAQLAAPEALIAIDLEPDRPTALDDFIAEQGLSGSVFVHTGVDQSDRKHITELLAEHLEGEPLDLVFDDASHFLDESRATLETLLPHLRPGGLYVIEDWSWAHAYMEVWPERAPLTALVLELAIVSVRAPEVIASVEIDRGFAIVRRGAGTLTPGAFSLSSLLDERGAAMAALVGRPPTRGRRKRRLLDRLRD
jgi:predicted O-methyltransferase YrrM